MFRQTFQQLVCVTLLLLCLISTPITHAGDCLPAESGPTCTGLME